MATKQQIFPILRSLVDAQMPKLRAATRDADKIPAQIKNLSDQIRYLDDYIEQNYRFDPRDCRDAADEIDDAHERIAALRARADAANRAIPQLDAATKFYQTYNTVMTPPQSRPTINSEIARLEYEYRRLDAAHSALCDKIDVCRINMDVRNGDDNLAVQSARDLEYYTAKSEQLAHQMQSIRAQIKQFQK